LAKQGGIGGRPDAAIALRPFLRAHRRVPSPAHVKADPHGIAQANRRTKGTAAIQNELILSGAIPDDLHALAERLHGGFPRVVSLAGEERMDQKVDFDVIERPLPKDAIEGGAEPGPHVGMGQVQAEDVAGSGRLEFSGGSVPGAEDPVRVFPGQLAAGIHTERSQPKPGLVAEGVKFVGHRPHALGKFGPREPVSPVARMGRGGAVPAVIDLDDLEFSAKGG